MADHNEDIWLQRLNDYNGLVKACEHLELWQALFLGGGLLGFLNLVFVLQMSPHTDAWVALSLIGLPLMLLGLPWAKLRLRRLRKQKNHLAKQFFLAGMQVEETGKKLVTNEAHSEIIAVLSDSASSRKKLTT
ncbi:hypothetical protein [Marinospirillum sp.]|uniref:hypothetical protein n=1 Tax=Marinospirillum sp. TaxID=2183934 RepID=UPI002870866C|nr:hypothetical protein [Marinospirillum sp.]MDR9468994.1 hypothetical protein [Marinospirillum sp.]